MKFAQFFFITNLLLLSNQFANAQEVTQTLRGKIVEQRNDAPVPYANVLVLGTSPLKGAVTDTNGNFRIQNLPVGRYDIQIQCLGYATLVVNEVLVTSSKEAILYPKLGLSETELSAINIVSKVNKSKPVNLMNLAGARMLSIEEARRYAGGFDDPARLAMAFAGVAGNVGSNGMVIRGNAPRFFQWRIEGVEVPNPNHFADLSAFGGGGLMAVSSNLLANSDFMTAAFPAEYGNALSGLFDLQLRKGNEEKREHTFSLGLIGIDFASEGPLKKGKSASYVLNYRYSTLALAAPFLPVNAGGIRYQDLNFKFNLPTKKVGTFTIWGSGLKDQSGAKAKLDSTDWKYNQDKDEQKVTQQMGAFGVGHKLNLNENLLWKSTLAATHSGIDLSTKQLDKEFKFQELNHWKNYENRVIFNSVLQTDFSKLHLNRSGITATLINYELQLSEADSISKPLRIWSNGNGTSGLLSAYSSSLFHLNEKFELNIGLNVQHFTLNQKTSVEPRAALTFQSNEKTKFAFAYGLHSRLERIHIYFQNYEGKGLANRNMDFAKAHHFLASTHRQLGKNLNLKVETYFQWLYSIPIVDRSSFSLINSENDWIIQDPLVNQGLGRNYGLELTLEKYLSGGYYYLISTTLFQSEYKAGDGVWRQSRFSKNYIFNFLVGKEWLAGADKNKIISANIRFNYQGGNRYTPLDLSMSMNRKEPIEDAQNAYSQQFDPAFLMHFTISYKKNNPKTTREWALKVINSTAYADHGPWSYNHKNGQFEMPREAIFIPNLSYRIDF